MFTDFEEFEEYIGGELIAVIVMLTTAPCYCLYRCLRENSE